MNQDSTQEGGKYTRERKKGRKWEILNLTKLF